MKPTTPISGLAIAALVALAVPGCINNEDAKPLWTYSVCIDICGASSSGGQQGGSGSGGLPGGQDAGTNGGQLAGQNTACGALAGQCGCTLGADLFCGQCTSAPAAQQCVYCPSGTICSPDSCTPSCTVPQTPPPQPMPTNCATDCGGGRCCPGGYPVCCSNAAYCGVSAVACAGAGTLPAGSGNGSGGSGSGSNSGSGGSGSGGSGGGTCPCLATSAPQYAGCMGGDQAACYCAAAWLDNCGIQNAAGCCNAGSEASCVSQLKSDCAAQAQNAVSLASAGVSPECSLSDFGSCQ